MHFRAKQCAGGFARISGVARPRYCTGPHRCACMWAARMRLGGMKATGMRWASSQPMERMVLWRQERRKQRTNEGASKTTEGFDGGVVCDKVRKTEPPVKRGYYKSREARIEFLQSLARAHGVEEPEDWLNVTVKDAVDAGGARVLAEYKYSLVSAVKDLLPACQDLASSHGAVSRPSGYWKKQRHRKAFFDEVAKEKGVRELRDWKTVMNKDIRKKRGGGLLLEMYRGSLSAALRDTYVDDQLTVVSTRGRVPATHWESLPNRRAFLEEVSATVGLSHPTQWATVSHSAIQEMGGSGLLKKYGTLLEAAKATFVEDEALREVKALEDMSAREFLDGFAARNGIHGPDDWARVGERELLKSGGGRFLRGRTVYSLLTEAYPEQSWMEAQCRPRVASEHWESEDNIREFLDHVKEELRITEKEEWYRISWEQIRSFRGHGLLRKMPLLDALRVAYKEEDWDEEWLNIHKKSTQRKLKLRVEDLFPSNAVLEDYRDHSALLGPQGKPLELDIYLPEHQLAFEYHGEQHYHEVPFFGPLELTRQRDILKRELCKQQGIKLVEVPYWWDQKLDSLLATVLVQFPALSAELKHLHTQ